VVSLTVVPDPYGSYEVSTLEGCFDVVTLSKQRYYADLTVPAGKRVSKHHRRNIRRSQGLVTVEALDAPEAHVSEWAELYGSITERHGLSGLKAFSREAFERQLRLPGTVLFRGRVDGATVAMTWWFIQGDVAYGHLVGVTAAGYQHAALYALDQYACEWFGSRCRWLDFGGVAGTGSDGDGLGHYKRGWCTGSTQMYLCGRVLDARVYEQLSASVPTAPRDYFPRYRCGEFL